VHVLIIVSIIVSTTKSAEMCIVVTEHIVETHSMFPNCLFCLDLVCVFWDAHGLWILNSDHDSICDESRAKSAPFVLFVLFVLSVLSILSILSVSSALSILSIVSILPTIVLSVPSVLSILSMQSVSVESFGHFFEGANMLPFIVGNDLGL